MAELAIVQASISFELDYVRSLLKSSSTSAQTQSFSDIINYLFDQSSLAITIELHLASLDKDEVNDFLWVSKILLESLIVQSQNFKQFEVVPIVSQKEQTNSTFLELNKDCSRCFHRFSSLCLLNSVQIYTKIILVGHGQNRDILPSYEEHFSHCLCEKDGYATSIIEVISKRQTQRSHQCARTVTIDMCCVSNHNANIPKNHFELKIFGNLNSSIRSSSYDVGLYGKGVYAGTFDRLHVGHKYLLTLLWFLATEEIHLGITLNPLSKKEGAEYVESYETRVHNVEDHLCSIAISMGWKKKERRNSKNRLLINKRESIVLQFFNPIGNKIKKIILFSLTDPIGPAATENFYDFLLVTEDTLVGAQHVNDVRNKNNLKELKILLAPLLNRLDTKNTKVSSTDGRKEDIEYFRIISENSFSLNQLRKMIDEQEKLCAGKYFDLILQWVRFLPESQSRSVVKGFSLLKPGDDVRILFQPFFSSHVFQ